MPASPKFSFRPRTRSHSPDKFSPGPGTYSAATHNHFKFPSAQNAGFGTASRDAGLRRSSSPGPGAYAVPKHGCVGDKMQVQPAPQWSFGSQEKLKSPRNQTRAMTPGPGVYDIPSKGCYGKSAQRDKSPTWRFGSEPRMHASPKHVKETPGPGTYVGARPARDKSPTWRFGSQQKLSTTERFIPGPGTYDTLAAHAASGDHGMKAKAPKWTFGTEQRGHTPHLHVRTTPGPGAYGGTYTTFDH